MTSVSAPHLFRLVSLATASRLATACTLWCASSAYAGVSIAGTGTGAAGGMTPTNATALQVNRAGGTGHMAVIPYFSTQSGNTTLVNITNTDPDNGKVVKVRFRSAVNADSVYNFTVLLSPGDVWAANISQGSDGRSALTTSDRSCTLPAVVNGPFVTDRLPLSALTVAQQAEWTREGYVEIITVADITRSAAGTNPLATAIANTAAGPLCGTALTALATNPSSEAAAAGAGLDTPSAGLLVSSILINVAGASVAWTTPTTAITAVDSAGNPARGRMVFSPQTAATAPNSDLYTNDPLLRTVAGGGSGKLAAKQHDLPDLSTPYVGSGTNAVDFPFRHVESLAQLLAVKTLRNEYLAEPSINAHTDWTFTQPLRRFAYGVDYSASPFASVSNGGVAGPTRYSDYRALPSVLPNGCLEVGQFPRMTLRDRMGGDIAGFPGSIYRGYCVGVTLVIRFRDSLSESVSAVLRNSLSTVDAEPLTDSFLERDSTVAGWGVLGTSNQFGNGLPVVGAAYIQATGPQVAGKSTNFGVLYNHDVSR